jgi:hypothetical protein
MATKKASEGSHAQKIYHTNKALREYRAALRKTRQPNGRRALRPQEPLFAKTPIQKPPITYLKNKT